MLVSPQIVLIAHGTSPWAFSLLFGMSISKQWLIVPVQYCLTAGWNTYGDACVQRKWSFTNQIVLLCIAKVIPVTNCLQFVKKKIFLCVVKGRAGSLTLAMVKNRQDQTGEWEISISSSGKSLANSIHSVTNIPRITLPLWQKSSSSTGYASCIPSSWAWRGKSLISTIVCSVINTCILFILETPAWFRDYVKWFFLTTWCLVT